MRIFKFGGASVKDADGLKNVRNIISAHNDVPLLVVVSAMGKTTNKLELVMQGWYTQDLPSAVEHLFELRQYHVDEIKKLPIDSTQLLAELESTIAEMKALIYTAPNENYNLNYDQLVSYGELISAKVLAGFLKASSLNAFQLDARNMLVTNDCFRDARINWSATQQNFTNFKATVSDPHSVYVIQGFIGQDESSNLTTTLGREGSDFTASICAYCLDAEEVTIWKDVQGVLNADPRFFPYAKVIPELTYREAVEMTYYGASVIHPKTIKPLQNKGIPMKVRSFLNMKAPGTTIAHFSDKTHQFPSCIIVKSKQVLIKFSSRDFSFIAEESLSKIFIELYSLGIKANLTQNSAVSFNVIIDNDPFKIAPFRKRIEEYFDLEMMEDLELLTVRHYSDKLVAGLISGKAVILEQRSKETIQLVLR